MVYVIEGCSRPIFRDLGRAMGERARMANGAHIYEYPNRAAALAEERGYLEQQANPEERLPVSWPFPSCGSRELA